MSDHELEALLLQPASPDYSDSLLNELSSTLRRERKSHKEDKPLTKAQREKARRAKLNKRFAALAELSNPEEPKNDKMSILLDALRTMKSLKKETDQLKQVNKFLQEKVNNYEKERSFVLYQQSMMLNQQQDFFPSYAVAKQPREQTIEVRPTVMGTPVIQGVSDEYLHPPAA